MSQEILLRLPVSLEVALLATVIAILLAIPLGTLSALRENTVLDHIVPHRGVAALYWDQSNWQGLCVTCHGSKTAREVWGRGSLPGSAASPPEIHGPLPENF